MFSTVGYLNYVSDNGDVNVALAGAESKKPQWYVLNNK